MKTEISFLVGFFLILFSIPNLDFSMESNEKDSRIYFEPEIQINKNGLIFRQQILALFEPYVTRWVGSWPEAVAIGDVNGDDRNDVVMTTSFYFDPKNDYKLFVFLQNLSSGLDTPVKYNAGDGDSIDIGDLNNDGKNDVVVTNYNEIGVFLQNDSETLDPMILYSATNDAYKVRVGDYNNDGLKDVASIAEGGSFLGYEVNVFLQNVSGTLNPPDIYTVIHEGFDDLEVGDINNDGLTDIIVMSGQGFADNLGVLYQNTGGSFDPPVYYDLGGDESTEGVAIGDVNGDSLGDIVVTYGGNKPSSHIGVFLQNTTGILDSPISYESYDCPEPVVIGGVNSDQKQDVVVAHGGWNAMGVYVQNNNGSLQEEELYDIPYASHYNPHGLAMGDINSDWKNDIVIADYNHGLVILYGTQTQKHTLAIATGEGGTTNPSPGTHVYDVGEKVSISAIPENGYGFTSWSGNASGTDNPIRITMDSDKSIKANFVRQYSLTLTSGAGGTIDPPPGSYNYDEGTEFTITAKPNTHYRFSEWTGDVHPGKRTSNPITIIMDSDKSIKANFIRIIYAPLNFTGKKVLNRSLSQAEYINVLNWQANPNNVNIVKYRIYILEGVSKNLLVEQDANAFEYWHRDVEKDKQHIYGICAVNDEDREGDPSYATVQ